MNGRLIGFIPGAPFFVNQQFLALFGGAGIPEGYGIIYVQR